MRQLEELISDWMEHLFIQKGHQARGVEQYALILRSFFLWLSRKGDVDDPNTITRGQIEEWQKALFFDQANISNRTRASKLSALRSFFGWMKYEGHRPDDPTKGIPTPKIGTSLPQKFSTDELRKLFSAPRRDKIMGLRDLAILKVMYAAGPRVSELCNLNLNDVSDSGGYIRIQFKGGKGNKDRTITLQRNPSRTLRDWIAARRGLETDNNALFTRLFGKKYTRLSVCTAQNILQKYAKVVGIDSVDVFAHKMRGTFATDLYDSGDDCCPRCKMKIHHVDLLLVQLAMGHADPKTTMPYIAVSDRYLKRTAIPDRRFNEIEGER